MGDIFALRLNSIFSLVTIHHVIYTNFDQDIYRKKLPDSGLIMTIYLGADHGGWQLKEVIKKWLMANHYSVKDLGAKDLSPSDDYPDYAFIVARAVANEADSLGLLFCRSGAGMAIVANKLAGVRAVEAWNEVSAVHAKEHNHANILALSGQWLNMDQTQKIVAAFLQAKPDQDERHLRRINKISQIEQWRAESTAS